jgi:hypothetical protein
MVGKQVGHLEQRVGLPLPKVEHANRCLLLIAVRAGRSGVDGLEIPGAVPVTAGTPACEFKLKLQRAAG